MLHYQNSEIGQRLKEARKRWTRLTQQDMAVRCQVSRNHISCIERGVYKCNDRILKIYSEETGVSTDELLGTGKGESGVLPELEDMIRRMDLSEQEEVVTILRERGHEYRKKNS